MPVVRTTAPAANAPAVAEPDPGRLPGCEHQIVDLAFDHREIGRAPERLLHGGRIELSVRLGARTTHGRSLAAIEHAELDAAGIGDPAHQAIERIDLADQMALAETPDRGIAGHRANGRKSVGQQRRARAHARGRGRGFAAGMPATDDNHIEALVHFCLQTNPVLDKCE